MKIIKLSVENFMRLVAVEITPDGNTIIISGKNGAGKSAVLNAIVAAFKGGKSIPGKPIRDGEERGEITIETESFIIKRVFTEKGSRLEISNSEGMTAKSPQALLDKIVGEIAFDPTAFMGFDAIKQRTILMELAKLNFDDLDEKLVTIKAKRSTAKTGKEYVEHELSCLGEIPEDTPTEEVSTAKLAEELQQAVAHNAEGDRTVTEQASHQLQFDNYMEHKKQILSNINSLKTQILEAEEGLKEKDEILTDLFQTIQSNADIIKAFSAIDTNAINEKIAGVEEANIMVRKAIKAKEYQAKINEHKKAFADGGKDMKRVNAEKSVRLACSEMPVAGLAVDEDGIVFEGIPFDQVNDAKKLEICVAISMATNPKLRVIRMSGNDLDSDSLEIIKKLAKDKGYQLWIERIDGGEAGIIIEEGQVKDA